MSKILTAAVLSVALTGAAIVAEASNEQGRQLSECKQQLAAIYGEETRVRISGKAAGSESTLKFHVYPEGGRLLRVSCTREVDGAVSMMDQYGMVLFEPEQEGEKLTAL